MTHADEGGVTDIVITVLCFLSVIPLWLGSIYIFIYRDYSPFKVKQVPVMLVSSISGSIFILADIYGGSHFNHFKPETCTLWRYWLQLLLGYGPWVSCLITRSVRLYIIFVDQIKEFKGMNKKLSGFIKNRTRLLNGPNFFWVYLAILEIPWLLLAALGQGLGIMTYDHDKNICVNTESILTTGITFALIIIYALFFLVLNFLLRGIRPEYNDFQMVRIGIPLVLIPLVANGIFYLLKIKLDASVGFKIFGRAFLTVSIIVSVIYFFWAPIAVAMYKHMTSREVYLKEFVERARRSSDDFVRIECERKLKALEALREQEKKHDEEKGKESEDHMSLTKTAYMEDKNSPKSALEVELKTNDDSSDGDYDFKESSD